MAEFVITAESPETGGQITLHYDTGNSSLRYVDGSSVLEVQAQSFKDAEVFDFPNPVGKSSAVKTLKIQLGLSCNYECTYCSQRFVPKADETNQSDVPDFLANIEANLQLGDGTGVKVEFWGGEPFVYWKTMKHLAEALHAKYPQMSFSTITNGSLLTDDKVDWLYDMGFGFAISHDGPDMQYRGPDPLQDPEVARVILRAYKRFAPEGRISFNAMMHAKSIERAPIIQFFKDFTGDDRVNIGEGSVVDAYDEGGAEISLNTKAEQFAFRRKAFEEFMSVDLSNWSNASKADNFIETLKKAKPYTAIAQKCGMDKRDKLAIDLKGNVLTCQNVSPVSGNPHGKPHLAGTIADMGAVKIQAATHLSKRKECPTCPVVHLCMGACMFLDGKLWETSCNNSYTDNIGPFAYAIYKLTNHIPVWIEHMDLPDSRKDVFGSVVVHKEDRKP